MLSDDVEEAGYVLLCVGEPETDCKIRTIEEVRKQQILSGFIIALLSVQS